MSDEQQTQAGEPSGPGWRDVEVGEVLQHTDMLRDGGGNVAVRAWPTGGAAFGAGVDADP